MMAVVAVTSLVLTVYLELSSKENIMTIKKIAIIAVAATVAIVMLPVILMIQAVSMALWYLGLAQSTNITTKYSIKN